MNHLTTEAALRMLATAIASAVADEMADNLKKLRALVREARLRGGR